MATSSRRADGQLMAAAGVPPAASGVGNKRKRGATGGPAATAATAKRSARGARAPSCAAKFSHAACARWFESFADPENPDTIGIDGIERLCAALALDPSSFEILVLAFTLGAKTMGEFTRAEWTITFGKLEIDTTAKLAAFLATESACIRSDRARFRQLYIYAFHFARGSARAVDTDTAIAMWELLFPHHFECTRFVTFLTARDPCLRAVSRDQWNNVPDVWAAISKEGAVEEWDADKSVWPSLFDEYVNWLREGGSMPSS